MGVQFDDLYAIGKPLSQGSEGEVCLAFRRSDGFPFAVKVMDRAAAYCYEDQIRVMQGLDHASIVKMVDWFSDEQTVYVVMELVQGGDMLERILKDSRLSEPSAAAAFRQVLLAVEHMHSKGLAHNDIKLENLLVDGDDVKLCDFGACRPIDQETCYSSFNRTLAYTPPEVLEGRDRSAGSGDMWSLGVLLYTMLAGYTPFGQTPSSSTHKVMKKILKGRVQFFDDSFNTVSAEAIDLISQLLQKDPSKRMTLCEALCHPWLAANVPDVMYTTNN